MKLPNKLLLPHWWGKLAHIKHMLVCGPAIYVHSQMQYNVCIYFFLIKALLFGICKYDGCKNETEAPRANGGEACCQSS